MLNFKPFYSIVILLNLDTPSGTSSIAETDVANQVNTKNNF